MNSQKTNFEVIKKYMEIDAISRHEEPVAEKFKLETQSFGVNYQRDGFGSVVASFPKLANKHFPKVLLAGHMDEIGYVVLDLYDNGQVRLSSVGGIWPPAVVGAKVALTTCDNKKFYGVLGHTSVHILPPEKRKEALKETDLFADFGFKSKDDAQAAGVEPGNPIHLQAESFMLENNFFAGKAVDNRIAVAVLELLIKKLAQVDLKCDPYFACTVQEEVGCRGAKTVTQLINPDVAIAVDVCTSHDTTGCIPGVNKAGNGVCLAVKDSYTLLDPKLIKFLTELAKKHKIKLVKYVAQGGGTDALNLQYAKSGVPTLIIGIPQRYLHSPYGVASLDDFDALVQLLTEFLKVFDGEVLSKISYK